MGNWFKVHMDPMRLSRSGEPRQASSSGTALYGSDHVNNIGA